MRKLERELGSLKKSGCGEPRVYADRGDGRYVRPDRTLLGSDFTALSGLGLVKDFARDSPGTKVITLSPDPNGGELFDITSMGKDMGRIVTPLTHRETQILNHVANGNTNKQIAHVLGISEQTIKSHVSAILRKLNANDRAHAVYLSMRDGRLSVGSRHEDMVAVS